MNMKLEPELTVLADKKIGREGETGWGCVHTSFRVRYRAQGLTTGYLSFLRCGLCSLLEIVVSRHGHPKKVGSSNFLLKRKEAKWKRKK
jgi:hypothetical protein